MVDLAPPPSPPEPGCPVAAWVRWVDAVAPLGGPTRCHRDLRYLARIDDRELAALAAEQWHQIKEREAKAARRRAVRVERARPEQVTLALPYDDGGDE